MGKEYEAGFGDVEANPKFNVFLRANPEILRIYGVPESTIADIMGLESELPEELGSGTKFSVQEVPGGGLVIKN
jgi:cystathionine beta-lyase family protein involved in aluminum resistance